MPHFDLTITLGNLITIFTIAGATWHGFRFAGRLEVIMEQHGMMWSDYKARKDINGKRKE